MELPKKVTSLSELYAFLPDDQRIILDVLRTLVIDTLPGYCREKISYNVPFFYGNKGICIIWPAAVPRGGIKDGVLFGFWYGNRLKDKNRYLTHGTNKQVFYKIYRNPGDIHADELILILEEAIILDKGFAKL